MPRRNDEAIREQLARLRDAHQHTSDRLTERLTEGLTQLHRDNSDTRRDLGDTLSGGLAELRHDNAQLRDQLTTAITDGVGALRAENLELRARLDRAADDLAETRRTIETMRAEAAEARLPARVAGGGNEGDRATNTSNSDDGNSYPDILQQAAGIAYARLECHRDTWDFLVAQAAQYEHFRLPSDVEDDDTGLIDVDLSGRTLIAVLDALWHTRHADETPAGTRALAAQVYERIAEAIATVQADSEPEEAEPAIEQAEPIPGLEVPEIISPDPQPTRRRVVHITIDDRPV